MTLAEPPGTWRGYPLADWGQRVGAYLIDAGIVVGIYFLVAMTGGIALAVIFGAYAGATGQEPEDNPLMVLVMIGFALFCFAVIVAATWWVRWRPFARGRETIGRRTLGLRLVRTGLDGRMSPGQAFLRDLCHYADSGSLYLGYLWPLWDDRRQTFADKIMQTVVLRER
jgi:uncharacterized RDD family membrane protein YckC